MFAVPETVTDDVRKFCGALVPNGTIAYVPMDIRREFEAGWCHYNVERMVAAEGGDAVFGWAIYENRSYDPVRIEAHFHSVWFSDGRLVDPTPGLAEAQGRMLFLADPKHRFDFEGFSSLASIVRDVKGGRFYSDNGKTFEVVETSLDRDFILQPKTILVDRVSASAYRNRIASVKPMPI